MAFFSAAGNGHIDIVQMRIAAGADVDRQLASTDNDAATSPLQVACEKGQVEVMETLLAVRAKVNRLDQVNPHKVTALDIASERGRIEAVRVLVAAGADVNQEHTVCGAHRRALHRASRWGHTDVVKSPYCDRCNHRPTGRHRRRRRGNSRRGSSYVSCEVSLRTASSNRECIAPRGRQC